MNGHLETGNCSIDKHILLTNIQRFSLHDGPGIRTTVFLKGCSIHCPWCSNPENLLHKEQRYIKKDHSGKIEEEGVYGKWYSSDELYAEVIKDKAFYGSCSDSSCENPSSNGRIELETLPGGVTFSGGECMLQMKELKPLLQRLNQEHIHTAVETSLYCSPAQLAIAVSYVDLFYVDIKILEDGLCSSILGGKIEYYKENLKSLLDSGKPVVFRVPVIGGYTDGEENRRAVVELIKSTVGRYKNVLKVEILKEHNLGMNKYQSLIDGAASQPDGGECGVSLPDYKGVSDELMERYKEEIESALSSVSGLQVGSTKAVEICKI